MTQCRYCKSDIPSDATRCPHCTSFLDGEQTQGSQGQVTYIVDKGLVTFAKFAAGALALFVTVGIFLYGLDIKQVSKEIGQVRKEIEDTHVESQRLDLNMRQAKLDMEKETADIQNEAADIQKETAGIKKDIKTAEDAAKVAGDTSLRAQSLLQEAEESAGRIHRYEITLLAPSQGSKLPSNLQASQLGPDPGQVEHLVDTRILEALRNILTPKQYSSLKTKIVAKQNVGLRRQVFDAKNAQDLPGVLVRSEGDPPISDPAANEVYDNLEIIHRFFKEVFSWEIPDNKGKTIVAIIHYGKEYDNGLWNGQELVLGDGDGVIFRKGGFASLSILAHEIAISVNQWTAQLHFRGNLAQWPSLSRI